MAQGQERTSDVMLIRKVLMLFVSELTVSSNSQTSLSAWGEAQTITSYYFRTSQWVGQLF